MNTKKTGVAVRRPLCRTRRKEIVHAIPIAARGAVRARSCVRGGGLLRRGRPRVGRKVAAMSAAWGKSSKKNLPHGDVLVCPPDRGLIGSLTSERRPPRQLGWRATATASLP